MKFHLNRNHGKIDYKHFLPKNFMIINKIYLCHNKLDAAVQQSQYYKDYHIRLWNILSDYYGHE